MSGSVDLCHYIIMSVLKDHFQHVKLFLTNKRSLVPESIKKLLLKFTTDTHVVQPCRVAVSLALAFIFNVANCHL